MVLPPIQQLRRSVSVLGGLLLTQLLVRKLVRQRGLVALVRVLQLPLMIMINLVKNIGSASVISAAKMKVMDFQGYLVQLLHPLH